MESSQHTLCFSSSLPHQSEQDHLTSTDDEGEEGCGGEERREDAEERKGGRMGEERKVIIGSHIMQ